MVWQGRQAALVRFQHIAGSIQSRCGGNHILDSRAVAVAEGRAVPAPVLVARVHEIHKPAVQIISGRHVVSQPRRRVFLVPGEKDGLLPQARPQPGQVAAIPARREWRQVVAQDVLALFLGEQGQAIQDQEANPLRVAQREFQGDLRAGVHPDDRYRGKPQGLSELMQGVRYVFYGGRLHRQRI